MGRDVPTRSAEAVMLLWSIVGGLLIITEIVRGAEERDGRGKKRTNDLVRPQAMTTLPGTVLADYKWRLM